MVNKIAYTLAMLLALPFIYGALAIIFLVSGMTNAVHSIWRIWR